MADVLIVTGPMNSSQLGAKGYPWKRGRVIVLDVQAVGFDPAKGANQFHYAQALERFLGGESLRTAAARAAKEPVDHLALAWFSAGHGFASGVFKRGMAAQVDTFLCVDGCYTAFNSTPAWARAMAEGAASGQWDALVTASNTTPGGFPDAMAGWHYVFKDLGWAPKDGGAVAGFDTPAPSEVIRKGHFAWHGYPTVPHIKQVSTFGKAFVRAWDERLITSGGFGFLPGWFPAGIEGVAIGLGALGAAVAGWRWGSK
jgi:hypothetical protein